MPLRYPEMVQPPAPPIPSSPGTSLPIFDDMRNLYTAPELRTAIVTVT